MIEILQFFSKKHFYSNSINSENSKINYTIGDILYSPNQYERPRHHLSANPTPAHQVKKQNRYYIYSVQKSSNDYPTDSEIKSRNPRSSPTLGNNKRTTDDRKTISKNISMVLENLLQSYENSQLPTHNTGKLKSIHVPKFHKLLS
jgi:hypothetical protein